MRSGFLKVGSGLPSSTIRAFLGDTREDRRLDVHHGAHAEGRAMMLVEHDRVEADVLGIDHLVEIFVVEPGALFAIEKFIRHAQSRRGS